MNIHIRSLALIAIAASLPFATAAQSTQNPASKSPSASASSAAQSPSSQTPSSASQQQRSSSSGSATLQASASTSGSSLSKIQKITQDSMRSQLTAKDLMGETIYDNRGERIGTVENIILTAVVGQSELARGFLSRESSSASATLTPTGRDDANQSVAATGSVSTRSAGATSASGSSAATTRPSSGSEAGEGRTVLGAAGTTGVNAPTSGQGGLPPAGTDASNAKGAAGAYGTEAAPSVQSRSVESDRSVTVAGSSTTRTTPPASASVSAQSNASRSATGAASMQGTASMSQDSGATVVISTGSFLGMGGELLSVPMSELSYDYSNDRIVLNVSQQEIKTLTNSGSATSAN